MSILQVLIALSFSASKDHKRQVFIFIELSKPTSKITHQHAATKSFTLVFELN